MVVRGSDLTLCFWVIGRWGVCVCFIFLVGGVLRGAGGLSWALESLSNHRKYRVMSNSEYKAN